MGGNDVADNVNPLAPHVLPFFAPGADGSDQMMLTTGIVLAVGVMAIGVLFFVIHSLPERMAHRSKKVQMEVVAVLCLLALLTHIHAFWVAGLLLALIDVPTLANPVERIAGSLERIADRDVRPADDMAPTIGAVPEPVLEAPAPAVAPVAEPPAAAEERA
jgi:hypothetical protein